MKALKLPRVSERQEQAAIVKLLRSLGGQVYVIGTVRPKGDFHGTCQTPGIPDLLCFLPRPRAPGTAFLFIEVKARAGRISPAQHDFADLCENAAVVHLFGGVDAVLAWVTEAGYLR